MYRSQKESAANEPCQDSVVYRGHAPRTLSHRGWQRYYHRRLRYTDQQTLGYGRTRDTSLQNTYTIFGIGMSALNCMARIAIYTNTGTDEFHKIRLFPYENTKTHPCIPFASSADSSSSLSCSSLLSNKPGMGSICMVRRIRSICLITSLMAGMSCCVPSSVLTT